MSAIENLVNSHMKAFFQQINERYSVPVSELSELWQSQIGQLGNAAVSLVIENTKSSPDDLLPTDTTSTDTQTKEYSEEYLITCSTAELKAICKSKKLKKYSKLKKLELIGFILNKKVDDVKPTTPKKKAKKKQSEPKVTKVVKNAIPKSIEIRRNDNGDYMHVPTKLVFHKETKQVIGKYEDGKEGFKQLTLEDVETCKQYNFSYELPENLIGNNVSKGKSKKEEDDAAFEKSLDDMVAEEVIEDEEEEEELDIKEDDEEEVVIDQEKEKEIDQLFEGDDDEEEEEVVEDEEEEEVVEDEEEEEVVEDEEEEEVVEDERGRSR